MYPSISCRSVYISCLLSVAGCSGIELPNVDAEVAASTAMEQFDEDGDGSLDETELAACPALKSASDEYDTNGDRQIDRDELVRRLQLMFGRRAGLVSADCSITLNGRSLEGAKIRYVPEVFLGEGKIQIAEGVTNKDGMAHLGIASEQLPADLRGHTLMQVGLYRVEITHPSKKIPAKYNTSTELGFELHPDSHTGPDATFNLRVK